MTEINKIDEQLKILDIIYVAMCPEETFVNVILAIKELQDKREFLINMN